jgi:hypothetical protein
MRKKTVAPEKAGKKFWIIDMGEPGSSQGTFVSWGPYPSREAAEDHIKKEVAALWVESCGCLRGSDSTIWTDTQIIVEEVVRVEPVPHPAVTVELREI